MSDTVTFSKDGAIGSITLNRPPVNSYEISLMRALEEAIDTAIADADGKVVVLRSALEKFFSGGADIKAFTTSSTQENLGMVEVAHRALAKMADSPKIFIAAINGHALGGGMEMALACDLRYAAEGEYRMGLPEVTLGLLPGNGGTQRLPRLIGLNKALELMAFGTVVTPDEALKLGMVNSILPVEGFQEAVDKLAGRLARGATFAVGQIKRAAYDGFPGSLADGLSRERELLAPLFDSHDAQEGLSAFVEKRRAEFKGE
jgi:enoyl-CoA hydratase/carnithine racemase